MFTTIIAPCALTQLMASDQALCVMDCSFDLSQPGAGPQAYGHSHIAGARYAHLDHHLSAAPGAQRASGGRHPLPTRANFAAWLGRMGVTPATQVVVYDRQGANYCARLWWMLQWVGHEAAAVLDGGWQAWLAHAGAVTSGPDAAPDEQVAPYPLGPERVRLVGSKEVAQALAASARPGGQTLVDARATPRFLGEVEPLDPVAGHIPGALNRPFSANLDAQGFFKPAATLRAEFDTLLGGRDPATVVHHCGSGVSALPNMLAMELAGLGTSALYAGSWSEWCSDPSRPVAVG